MVLKSTIKHILITGMILLAGSQLSAKSGDTLVLRFLQGSLWQLQCSTVTFNSKTRSVELYGNINEIKAMDDVIRELGGDTVLYDKNLLKLTSCAVNHIYFNIGNGMMLSIPVTVMTCGNHTQQTMRAGKNIFFMSFSFYKADKPGLVKVRDKDIYILI